MMNLLADRQLPGEEESALVAHVEPCAACRSRHAELARLSQVLRSLDVPDPDESYARTLSTAVQERIREAHGRRGVLALGRRVARVARPRLLVAGAVSLVAIVCVGLLRGHLFGRSASADTLKAMAEVKTAHAVGTLYGMGTEIWLSADHGIRLQWPGRLHVSTSEATWDYDDQSNQVTISDPDPDAMGRALAQLSGTLLLGELRPEDDCRVSDVAMGGRAARRIDITLGHEEGRGTLWVDPDTDRVVRMQMSRTAEEGSRAVEDQIDFEYDVTVDPALFKFETPAGATVVDARIGSLQQIIDEAMKTAETTPFHEVTETKAHPSGRSESGLSWDHPARYEVWGLHGVGSRLERDDGTGKTVTVRHGKTVWLGSRRDAAVTETDDEVDEASAYACLYMFKQNFPRPDRPAEVKREERDGKPVAVLVRYYTIDLTRTKTCPVKEVTVFELNTSRLVELSAYYNVEGEWRLVKQTKYEYLDKLPEGVFEFKPAPGVTLRDLRNR